MEVRPSHLLRVQTFHKDGTIVMGGALLTKDIDKNMNGSVIVLRGDNEEEIRDWIKNDPFYQKNVWDRNNIEIHEFRPALHPK